MPIDLITGLPGNAKTLFALQLLIDRASREQRPVYYDGLKDFVVGDPRLKGTTWIQCDSSKWHDEVPNGSLIFIDEAQKVFRARNMGATPPKFVTELEEHRHRGIDFVMITQHPRLIDPAVKVLTQTHRHMVRISGWEMSTVHRWESIKADPEKPTSRKDSEKVKWSFAKDLYGLYKSADEHTIKKSIPNRVKLLVVLGLIFCGLAWYFTSFMSKKFSTPAPGSLADSTQGVIQGVNVDQVAPGRTGGVAAAAAAPDPLADIQAYAFKETPRVVGLPETAPKYDPLTVPVRVPVPAMCMQIGSPTTTKEIDCRCYSQQATRMDVEFNMCMEFARNGRFEDFDRDRDQRDVKQSEKSAEVLAGRLPDVSQGPGGPAVLSFPDSPPIPTVGKRAM